MTLTRRSCITTLLGTALPALSPPARAQTPAAAVADEVWTDATRKREVPVKIRWPDASVHAGTRPVVIFSHGLGGTTDGGAVWGEAWAAAGLVVLHIQHAGSDLPAVRGAASSFTDQRALRSLAGAEQLIARLRDVGFVLDELARRQASGARRWGGVRPVQVGMSGHSFGAHTTLGMAGQIYPGFDGVTEPRLASFIALSPTVPMLGDAVGAFARLTRPVLSVTGTRDADVVGTGTTPERRMAVYSALPAGHKAHLVLADADHMTFAGQTGRAVEIIPRVAVTRDLQAAQHAMVARITTDWWLATLAGDVAARERLQQPAGLMAGDLWAQG